MFAAEIGNRRRLIGLLAAGCLGFLSGCGHESRRCGLSGSVSFQGEAVDHGTITLLGVDGSPGPVAGGLIRSGRYNIPASRGVEPGAYRVVISWPGPGGVLTAEEMAAGASPRARERIPSRFNSETELRMTVELGAKNQFNFDLK